MSGPPRRIGLYGPFGWGNLGDAAIQESMIAGVRARVREAEFVGFSLNPENTEEIHAIPAVPILRSWRPRRETTAGSVSSAPTPAPPRAPTPRRLHPLKRLLRPAAEAVRELRFAVRAIRTLRRVDVLVFSGGGQITDDWGGPWDHPYTMLKWVLCAKAAGRPVYVVSVGAGPFRSGLSATLFRWVLRLADYRSYRDPESREFLRAANFSLPARVAPDLAFGLPPHPSIAPPADPLRVGISPMSYFHPTPGAWPEHSPERYERYLGTLAGFAHRLRVDGHPLVLFSSQIRNDRLAFDDLLGALGGTAGAPPAGVTTHPTGDLPHLLAQIAACDVVVTSRLHGVILSYLHHRPVIALSYDPKIEAVMRQFGQSDFCLDIERGTPQRLEHCFRLLRRDLEGTRDRIRRQAASHRARLDEQFDRLFGRARTPGPG